MASTNTGLIKSKEAEEYVNSLREELARSEASRAALIQEFSDTAKAWTAEDIKEKLRKDLLPRAWARLAYLLENADNESVQAGIAKYIVNLAIGAVKINSDNDPELGKLLSALLPDAVSD